jgi:hypothetical protein
MTRIWHTHTHTHTYYTSHIYIYGHLCIHFHTEYKTQLPCPCLQGCENQDNLFAAWQCPKPISICNYFCNFMKAVPSYEKQIEISFNSYSENNIALCNAMTMLFLHYILSQHKCLTSRLSKAITLYVSQLLNLDNYITTGCLKTLITYL